MSRLVMIFFVILILLSGAYFFFSSSSYQKSLQARVNYFLGDYKSAYMYAKKAYDEDNYNKMAFSVLTQSKIALEYTNYIKRGKDYIKQLDAISSKPKITKSDKSRIKLICEIMIGEYENLTSSLMSDEKLKENAKITYKKFKQVHNELF